MNECLINLSKALEMNLYGAEASRRIRRDLAYFRRRQLQLERHSVQYGAAEEGKRHYGEGTEEDGEDPGGNVGKPSLIYPSAATIDIRPHRHQAPGPFQERKARRKILTLATVERETWLVTTIGYGITYIQWLCWNGGEKGRRKENEMKRRDTCVFQWMQTENCVQQCDKPFLEYMHPTNPTNQFLDGVGGRCYV